MKELINELMTCANAYEQPPYGLEVEGTVELLRKAAAKLDSGWWIPCSVRLPDESLNSVIGWDKYRNRCCLVQYYDGRWIFGDDTEPVRIIAWQPLPEPYKG